MRGSRREPGWGPFCTSLRALVTTAAAAMEVVVLADSRQRIQQYGKEKQFIASQNSYAPLRFRRLPRLRRNRAHQDKLPEETDEVLNGSKRSPNSAKSILFRQLSLSMFPDLARQSCKEMQLSGAKKFPPRSPDEAAKGARTSPVFGSRLTSSFFGFMPRGGRRSMRSSPQLFNSKK